MMFPFSPGLMYNFYRILSQEHGFRFEARNTFILVPRNLHELNRKEQNRPARNGFRACVEVGSLPVPPEVQEFL